MMAQRPSNTRVSQVINPGLDRRIPFGVVNVVIGKDGSWMGYMKDGKFYELGTDASVVDAQEKKTIAKQKEEEDAALREREQTDPFYAPFNDMKLGVTIDPQTGKMMVMDANKGEVFLYVGPSVQDNPLYVPGFNPKNKSVTPNTDVTVETNFDKVRNKMITDAAKIPGGTDALFDKLLSNGLISPETYKKRDVSAADFNAGLLYAVRKFTIETVDNYQLKGIKTPVNFTDYLDRGLARSKPTSKTSYDMVVTKRQDAANDADQFFMANVGRNATKEEEDAYYKLLREAEKKAIASTTTKYDADGNQIGRTQTGELLSDTDKTLLLGKVAGKAISGSSIDKLLSYGGKASQDVDSVLSYAKKYGVVLTKEQAMDYVANNFKKGQDLEASKAKILQIAKSLPQYAGIADKISDTVSVQDIAGNYMWQKAQILELSADSIDVFDKDIQDGLTGNMTMTDFNKKLRQNPIWANTKNAKEEAANYATDILKSFGLMA
jgi:hypothetical protein